MFYQLKDEVLDWLHFQAVKGWKLQNKIPADEGNTCVICYARDSHWGKMESQFGAK